MEKNKDKIYTLFVRFSALLLYESIHISFNPLSINCEKTHSEECSLYWNGKHDVCYFNRENTPPQVFSEKLVIGILRV